MGHLVKTVLLCQNMLPTYQSTTKLTKYMSVAYNKAISTSLKVLTRIARSAPIIVNKIRKKNQNQERKLGAPPGKGPQLRLWIYVLAED